MIRSTAKKVDGVGYLPTYAPASPEMGQARRVDVQIDLDSTAVDVCPEQGRLFEIAGEVKDDHPVQLTLAGETGRQTITAFHSFRLTLSHPASMSSMGGA